MKVSPGNVGQIGGPDHPHPQPGDPAATAQRWAAVLGIPPPGREPATVDLPDSGQRLRFVPAGAGRGEGITEVTIAGLPAGGGAGPWVIGGVRFAGEEG